MPTDREYFEEVRDVTFANAKVKGLEIVLPTAFQLQLDIDQPWTHHVSDRLTKNTDVIEVICRNKLRIREVLWRLLERASIEKWEAWKSSGGNCHVMLTLSREMDLETRISLQAILGSDPMRELLNLSRAWCGAEDPIALFRPKGLANG